MDSSSGKENFIQFPCPDNGEYTDIDKCLECFKSYRGCDSFITMKLEQHRYWKEEQK